MWTEIIKMVIKLIISGRLFISETSNWPVNTTAHAELEN